MSQDIYDWADENRGELLGALRAAGASEVAITLARTHIEGVRHSVLEELRKWADDGAPTVDSVEKAARLGGGFFQKVWDGDIVDAFLHADSNNQRLFREAFAREELEAQATEYETKLIRERW